MLARQRKGFTLAEVLITLAVIGVVAAMVIPALLNSTNQAELKTGLKKSLATLNQGLAMAIALEGNDASSADTTSAATQSEGLAALYSRRLSVVESALSSGTNSYIYTADGMKFQFVGAGTNACGTATNTCVVIVDVNGDKGPNLASNGTTYRDQYRLTINQANVTTQNTANDGVAADNILRGL